MKRINKIALLLSVLACFLPGCNKDTKEILPNGDPVTLNVAPVSLWNFQPAALTSRAAGAVNGWYNTPVHIAYGEDASLNYAIVLDGYVHNNITTFSPLLFYPTSGNIFLRGFYPRAEGLIDTYYKGKTSGGIVGNNISYTIDGSYDIMVSNEVSGSVSSPIAAYMYYSHLLTQLSFVLYSDGSFPSSARVKRIILNDVLTVVDLDLTKSYNPTTFANYPLSFSGAPTTITISLPGIGAAVTAVEGVGVKPAAVGFVMFEPGGETGSGGGGSVDDFISIVIDMTDVDGLLPSDRIEKEYKVTGLSFDGGTTKPGYHYEIALTFNAFTTIPTVSAAPTVVTPPSPVWPTTSYW